MLSNNIMEQVQTYLHGMASLSLEETKKVSLLNRVDQKFLLHEEQLPVLLLLLSQSYSVVEIEGVQLLPYSTLYFDTDAFHYYHMHHNGNFNRYKFRSRHYLVGGQIFNEVKRKSNKRKTYKSRIARSSFKRDCDTKFQDFAKSICPDAHLECEILSPKLLVDYQRITLVNKNFSERMTIDLGLQVSHNDVSHQFEKLVIVELKRDKATAQSPGLKALKDMRCKQQGFSKYCIGVAITHDTVKTNNFKKKIRAVQKLCCA